MVNYFDFQVLKKKKKVLGMIMNCWTMLMSGREVLPPVLTSGQPCPSPLLSGPHQLLEPRFWRPHKTSWAVNPSLCILLLFQSVNFCFINFCFCFHHCPASTSPGQFHHFLSSLKTTFRFPSSLIQAWEHCEHPPGQDAPIPVSS